MAIEFTVKEARQLIEQHKALLSNLEYIASKATGIQAEITRSANDLIAQTALKRIIVNDCKHPTEQLSRTPERCV